MRAFVVLISSSSKCWQWLGKPSAHFLPLHQMPQFLDFSGGKQGYLAFQTHPSLPFPGRVVCKQSHSDENRLSRSFISAANNKELNAELIRNVLKVKLLIMEEQKNQFREKYCNCESRL